MGSFDKGMKKHTRHQIFWDALWVTISGLVAFNVITSHVDDGNTFAIYYKEGSLLIGDFWSGLLVVVCTVSFICYSLDFWKDVKYYIKLRKKSPIND